MDTARFDLTLEAFPRKGELDIFFDYNRDLYDAGTIARLQQHYLAVLRAVVSDRKCKDRRYPAALRSGTGQSCSTNGTEQKNIYRRIYVSISNLRNMPGQRPIAWP